MEPQERAWPFTSNWDADIVDTFCHLNDVFRRLDHAGTFAEFRLKHRSTFPYNYGGCVANFTNPVAFERHDRWQALLAEDCVWGSFGCPPYYADEYSEGVEKCLRRVLGHDSAVAVGRIGLDYSESPLLTCKNQQKHALRRQLLLAAERRLPVVLYSRNATFDIVQLFRNTGLINHRIQLEGFCGEWPEAKFWLDTFPNLYLGLTPELALPCRGDLVKVAGKALLNRVLFETAAPQCLPSAEARWLAGSHPGMVVHVPLELSRILDLQVEEVAAIVRENTRRFYGI
ncbi:3'-5' RNA nuclease TATDN2-like [Amblyomma americanum]